MYLTTRLFQSHAVPCPRGAGAAARRAPPLLPPAGRRGRGQAPPLPAHPRAEGARAGAGLRALSRRHAGKSYCESILPCDRDGGQQDEVQGGEGCGEEGEVGTVEAPLSKRLNLPTRKVAYPKNALKCLF